MKKTASTGLGTEGWLRSPKAKAVYAEVGAALADPETRAKLTAHAEALNDAVRAWRDKRRAAGEAERGGRPRKGVFGQRRLESRCRHVSELLESIEGTDPDLASSLEPLRSGIRQVETALKVTAGYPLVKRKVGHRRIDSQLDEIERTLLDAVMQGGADPV